jgi:hypothetical protein
MNDPTRLGDPRSKRSASLRRMIAAGRSEVPDAVRMEALASRLGFGAVAPLAGIGSTKPVAAIGGTVKTGVAATLGAATKIGAVAILVLGTAGGVVVANRGSSAPVVVASPARAVRPSSLRTPLDGKNAEPSSDPSLQAPWQPVLDTAVPDPATDAPASNDHAAPAIATPHPTPGAAHQNAAAGPVADTEVSLLDEAQAALRTDPQRALDLTAREASRFPAGSLTQEREVIAIEALARLGRIDDARARARQFFQTFPRSAHRLRIAALVGLVDPPIQDPAP